MEPELLTTLLAKNIVRCGTEITVLREGRDLSGITKIPVSEILEIVQIKNGKIAARSTLDGKIYNAGASHINNIDGMEPDKLASIYHIKADGTMRPPGKKRGRKPKQRS